MRSSVPGRSPDVNTSIAPLHPCSLQSSEHAPVSEGNPADPNAGRIVAATTVVTLVSPAGQGPGTATRPDPAPKTSWGEPDLHGIWASEEQVPRRRPAKYAGREFFMDAEIADLDRQRAAILRRDLRWSTRRRACLRRG